MGITFDYMSAADAMVEKGDYVSALHYYFLQRNSRYYSDVDVAIGDVYFEMDLVEEATRYYMYAYAADTYNTDALEGLVCCFKEFDEQAALYYLHKTTLLDDSDMVFDPNDFDLLSPDYGKEPLVVHDKHDKEKDMDEAVDLMQNSKVDEAKEVLMSIGPKDKQFGEARLALASLALEESDPSKALEIAQDALSVDPKLLGCIVITIMAYDIMGDEEKMNEWIDRLDKLGLDDEEDITKAAMCLLPIDIDMSLKYFLRKLEFSPYDRMAFICIASIYSQKEDRDKAIKYIDKACTIYPEDVELKEIASRIYGGKFIMPKGLIDLKNEWSEKLKELFMSGDKDFEEPENMKLIKWLLQSENDMYLQTAVCTYVTGMPAYDKLINDVLLDPFVHDVVKRHILLRRFSDERQKKVKFVVSNIYRCVRIKRPDVPDNLKNAYYLVLASLALEEYNFDAALNRSLKRIKQAYDGLEDREKLSMGALAVLLHKTTVGGNEEAYCKIYDTDMDEYHSVAQKLGF